MDNSDFINLLIKGDETAFKELVEKYQLMIYNTCYSFIQDSQAADDVAQEVFIEVFESINKFRADSKLSTWMYRIAVNKSLNYIRSRKKHSILRRIENFFTDSNDDLEIESDVRDPEMILKNTELGNELQTAINNLPKNQRIAFTLHNIEDLPYKKISEIMGSSLSAVESLIHRAKSNLRKNLRM
jgi:RNA polymerase sigma-70 factor (ECF subfamily)